MAQRPDPAEAARALRDVEQRKDQAFGAVREPVWVRVVFGVVLLLLIAAPDFAGPGAIAWTSWGFALLAVINVAMLNTRRGSAILGRSVRVRKEELSPTFRRGVRLVFLVIIVAGIVAAFLPRVHLPIPYLRTILGALACVALIVFGPAYERSLLAFGRRGRTAGGPR